MNKQSGRSGRRDHGPQGTQVFSRDEVSRLIDEASADSTATAQAELIGISDPVSGKSWALSSTRLVVGRVDSCDIHLDDPSVSSEHARLTHDSEGWRVANLLSTNGTFVNDEKISNRALNDGDRLRFGRVELRFHGPQAPSKSRPGWLPWAVAAVALAIVAGIVIVLI